MNPRSIMIVETNPEMRSILRQAFEERGYMTWTCPGLDVASSIYRAIQPSYVILDLDFDRMDVITLLDAWHALSPHTRIVVESASADKEMVRSAMTHGAHAYLSKPYGIAPLFALLEADIPPNAPRSTPDTKAA